jgi:hypothetical protein
MKSNKTNEKLVKECLEHLENFSKEQLLEEFEQMLLSLGEQGEDLKRFEIYYSNNGLRNRKF